MARNKKAYRERRWEQIRQFMKERDDNIKEHNPTRVNRIGSDMAFRKEAFTVTTEQAMANTNHTFASAHFPELEGQLDATDFNSSVAMHTEDGGFIYFEDAFARQEGDYIVIYTEHNGYHVFHQGSFTGPDFEVHGQRWGTMPERFDTEPDEEE